MQKLQSVDKSWSCSRSVCSSFCWSSFSSWSYSCSFTYFLVLLLQTNLSYYWPWRGHTTSPRLQIMSCHGQSLVIRSLPGRDTDSYTPDGLFQELNAARSRRREKEDEGPSLHWKPWYLELDIHNRHRSHVYKLVLNKCQTNMKI